MSAPSSHNEFAAAGQPSPAFLQAVRGMQIVTFALALGSAFVTGIMLFLCNGEMNGEPATLSIIGMAMAVMHFVAHAIVPKLVIVKQLESVSKSEMQAMTIEDQQMTVMTSTRNGHIIGSALLEAAAVFNAIAYLMEKWVGSLAIAGVFVVLILLRMPTVYGTQNKINDRLREIEMS